VFFTGRGPAFRPHWESVLPHCSDARSLSLSPAAMEAATRHTTTATDGVRLSYTLVGTGPVRVVFIPGMCTPGAMWAPQVAAFLAGGNVSMCLLDNRTLQRRPRGGARQRGCRLAL